MATYYVRTNGNDTTGNGSTETPWKTISKALATVSAAGGHTVKVGAGTYAENTGGNNYLYISQTFADWVVFEPENGGDSVTITDNGHIWYTVRFATSSYVRFNHITFVPAVAKTKPTICPQGAVAVDHIYFHGCTIQEKATADANACVSHELSGVSSLTNITFEDCTLSQTTAFACRGIYLVHTVIDTITLDAITVKNCTINTLSYPLRLVGVTNILVDGGTYTKSGVAAAHAVQIGEDDTSGPSTTGIVRNFTATTSTNHGTLIGAGCANVVVSNIITHGGDLGLVVKENDGTDIDNCQIFGGTGVTSCAMDFKAATNASVHYSVIHASEQMAVRVRAGDSGNKCGNVDVQFNRIRTTGSAKVFSWGGDAADSGGGVCDNNTYEVRGTGKFGAVRGDADVQNLIELRAAWAGYGDGSNDSHSRTGRKRMRLLI